MSSHTPGPWRVDPEFRRDIQAENGALEICTVDSEGLNQHSYPSPQHDEALANARLIAAAPELLAALEEIVDAADGQGWLQIDASFKKQRAAIAKARGAA